MSWTDVTEYFTTVQICKVHDNFHYSFLEGNHKPDSFSLMRLIIEEDGIHYISVTQIDSRCLPKNSEYEYSNCRVILMKIDTDKTDVDEDGDNLEVDYIKGDQSWDRDTHLEN